MISTLEPSFSTPEIKNLNSATQSRLAIRTTGSATRERSNFEYLPYHRAVVQERAIGSLWNPRLLDSLTAPLTRHHE